MAGAKLLYYGYWKLAVPKSVFGDLKYVEVKFSCMACGQCCIGTEMELLPEDIDRLEALGYRLEDFAVRGRDGVWRLRNINGHCVFYDEESKKCKIYEYRPIGCRLYPLIYDGSRVTVDKQCPAWHTVPRSEVARLAPIVVEFVRRVRLTDDYVRVRLSFKVAKPP